MTLGAVVAVAGLAVAGLSIRWFLRAEGKTGARVGAAILTLVGLGLLAGGGWYGLVGHKMGKVEKAKARTAGDKVKKLITEFGNLLAKCKDQVFPAMPYHPSDEAKADQYKTAIKLMKAELTTCYTGSAGVGQEKGAELDQIKWLVADKTCPGFQKRLVKERTFCPQMVEVLVEKAKFKDPLAEAGGDDEKKPDAKALEAIKPVLARFEKKLKECQKEVFKVYAPPKNVKPEDAVTKGVTAVMQALNNCAAGKDGEELKPTHLEALLKAADCVKFGDAFRKMEVCSPALEAPTKAGFTFKEGGAGAGSGATDGTKAPAARAAATTKNTARPEGRRAVPKTRARPARPEAAPAAK